MEKEIKLQFSAEEKAAAFDEIADLFYKRNFGSASKTDIETLMFMIYMKRLIREHNVDGVLDYSRCSDYKIGRELGITPQRVSSLKVRMELKYPQQDFDWRKSLKKLISDPKKVHKSGDNIKINIPDPNLFYAIKDYIEDNSGIVDIQFNKSVLSLSQRDFLVLLAAIADEEERKKMCKAINEALEKEGKEKLLKASSTIEDISAVVGGVSEITGIIGTINDITNPGSWLLKAISALLKK